MAYSTSNTPYLLVPGLGGAAQSTVGASTAAVGFATAMGGGNFWGYRSSDPAATVVGSSYFTNGYNLGMRLADPIWVIDTGSTTKPLVTPAYVSAVTTAFSSGYAGVTVTYQTTGA